MRMRRPDGLLQRGDDGAAPRHLHAMSSQTWTMRAGRGDVASSAVERRHAPGVGRRNVQTLAHVPQPAFADPSDARLKRLERRKQQMARLARRSPAGARIRVTPIAARATVPRGSRRPEARVDGGALGVGGHGGNRANVHQEAGSTRTAQALNSAVPDFGSETSIVRRLVATSSG